VVRRRGLAKVNCGVKSSVVPHARWLFASILAASRDEGELVFVEAARPMVRHNPFVRIAGGGGVGGSPKTKSTCRVRSRQQRPRVAYPGCDARGRTGGAPSGRCPAWPVGIRDTATSCELVSGSLTHPVGLQRLLPA
jgi:hypothetical protein